MSSIKGRRPFRPITKPISGFSGTTGRNPSVPFSPSNEPSEPSWNPLDGTMQGDVYTNGQIFEGSFGKSSGQDAAANAFLRAFEAWSRGEGSNASMTDVLNFIGAYFGQTMSAAGSDSIDSTFMQQILATMLSNTAQRDQRQYDWRMKQEQRIYDSPTNQLARLMGAGISRDAAIQMIEGNNGGNVTGAGTAAAVASPSGVPGSTQAQDLSGKLSKISTAVGTVSSVAGLISNLVASGYSNKVAVAQARNLNAQAYMTEEGNSAYQAAQQVTNAIDSARSLGKISKQAFDGITNLDDMQNYMIAHPELFKEVTDSPAFARTFGSPLGRQFANAFWNELTSSRTAGDAAMQELERIELVNELAKIDKKQHWLDYNTALASMPDIVEKFHNEVLEGRLRIKIGGVEYQLAQNELKLSEFDVNRASTENEIFDNIYNNPSGADGTGLPGKTYLSYSAWNDLYKEFLQKSMFFNDDNEEKYTKILQNNLDTAYNASFIKWFISQNLFASWNPDLNPNISTILTTGTLLNTTGFLNAIDVRVVGDSNPVGSAASALGREGFRQLGRQLFRHLK